MLPFRWVHGSTVEPVRATETGSCLASRNRPQYTKNPPGRHPGGFFCWTSLGLASLAWPALAGLGRLDQASRGFVTGPALGIRTGTRRNAARLIHVSGPSLGRVLSRTATHIHKVRGDLPHNRRLEVLLRCCLAPLCSRQVSHSTPVVERGVRGKERCPRAPRGRIADPAEGLDVTNSPSFWSAYLLNSRVCFGEDEGLVSGEIKDVDRGRHPRGWGPSSKRWMAQFHIGAACSSRPGARSARAVPALLPPAIHERRLSDDRDQLGGRPVGAVKDLLAAPAASSIALRRHAGGRGPARMKASA